MSFDKQEQSTLERPPEGVPTEDLAASVKTSDEEAISTSLPAVVEWITGWRLISIALGTSLSLFMIQTESSITSTAITSITNDLGGFEKSSWIFTSYMLTYSGLPILFAKISDFAGRKQVLLSSIALFIVFSGACGGAKTLMQLIMFRWIQGIGASGIVSIAILYGFELRPPEKWAGYSAFITLFVAISLAIAPVIGAALTQAGQWRWCFLLNVPIGAATLVLLFFAMPNKLQLEPAARIAPNRSSAEWLGDLRRLDFLGSFLLIGASLTLLAALETAAAGASFKSAEVLCPLILAPVLLASFLLWQRIIATRALAVNSILSWTLITNRVFIAMLCNAWLSGMVLVVTIVQIPQRYMIVNSLSPVEAGVRLLPFAAVVAFTSVFVSVIVTKAKIPAVNVLFLGAILEIAGVAGLSKAPTTAAIEASNYGFQVLAGAGVGVYNIILILLTPYVVEKKELSVANGAVSQFRILGGSLGLAIVTCATSASLRASLLRIVSSEQAQTILERTGSIASLPLGDQEVVRAAFGEMYNRQMTILIGITAAQVLVNVLQWQRNAIVFKG